MLYINIVCLRCQDFYKNNCKRRYAAFTATAAIMRELRFGAIQLVRNKIENDLSTSHFAVENTGGAEGAKETETICCISV